MHGQAGMQRCGGVTTVLRVCMVNFRSRHDEKAWWSRNGGAHGGARMVLQA